MAQKSTCNALDRLVSRNPHVTWNASKHSGRVGEYFLSTNYRVRFYIQIYSVQVDETKFLFKGNKYGVQNAECKIVLRTMGIRISLKTANFYSHYLVKLRQIKTHLDCLKSSNNQSMHPASTELPPRSFTLSRLLRLQHINH